MVLREDGEEDRRRAGREIIRVSESQRPEDKCDKWRENEREG